MENYVVYPYEHVYKMVQIANWLVNKKRQPRTKEFIFASSVQDKLCAKSSCKIVSDLSKVIQRYAAQKNIIHFTTNTDISNKSALPLIL